MPNEFKIRNGFLSTGNSQITGSLNVTGGVTGSFSGNGAGLTGVAAFPFTGSALITGSLGVTGSASILAFTGSSATIFNVRNAANTYNLLSIDGTGYFSIANSTNGQTRFWVGTDPTYPTFNLGNSISADGFKTYVSAPNGSVQIEANGNGLNLSSGYGIYSTATIHQLYTSTTLRMHTDATGTVFGNSTSPGARLDVRAQGALSTDIAFRVRDSADTYNLLDLQGNSVLNLRVNNTATAPASGSNLLGTNTDVVVNARGINTSGTMIVGFQGAIANSGANVGLYADGGGKIVSSTAGILQHNSGAGNGRMNFVSGTNTTGWSFLWNTSTTFGVSNTVFSIYPTNAQSGGGTLALGTTLGTTVANLPAAAFGKNTFFIANGTAPTTSSTDSFALYSSDITAGNAAPHFRTENGSIIKLYKEIQPALSGSANTGDPATDALIEAMKTIILNLGFGASS
jgi:hypothetical protein